MPPIYENTCDEKKSFKNYELGFYEIVRVFNITELVRQLTRIVDLLELHVTG